MANRYGNLIGTNKIRDEYPKINQGFDRIQEEQDAQNIMIQEAQDAQNIKMQKHVEGTADKHNAEDISYGDTSVKEGLDQIKDDITTLVTTPIDGQAAAEELVLSRGTEPSLPHRLNKIDSQLAENVNQFQNIKSNFTHTSQNIESVVSFIDDDGHRDVYTRIKPIFQAENVPYNLAIPPQSIGESSRLSQIQLLELYNMGWEILGHEIGELPSRDDESLLAALAGVKSTLNSWGINVNAYVYPNGANDERVRRVTKEYYDFAFAGISVNESDLLNTMAINRIPFGSYTAPNPTINGNSEKNTLNYYKACVDYAITNKSWLVFMTHINVQDATQDQHLSDIVDYIKAQGVRIVTVSEGHRIHGNKIFAGDIGSGKYFTVNKYGKAISPDIGSVPVILASLDAFSNASLPSVFEDKKITITSISSSNTTGFPNASKGILMTYKLGTQANTVNYQIFTDNIGYIYRRIDIDSDTWGAWMSMNASTHLMSAASTITSSTPISNTIFGRGGTISYAEITASPSDFPTTARGILITYKGYTTLQYSYQEFYPRSRNTMYRRTWDFTNSVWNAFEQIYPITAP